MDIRCTPSPADLKVISEPGMFSGWVLSIDIDGQIYSTELDRQDKAPAVVAALRSLADKLDNSGGE